MKVDIIMPKMGESINEGTIIKWYKKVGDTVKKDEIIYEISTDKVDTEIPSPADGILVEIKAFENETVPINEVVAVIETDASTSLSADKAGSATEGKNESREVAEKKNEENHQQINLVLLLIFLCRKWVNLLWKEPLLNGIKKLVMMLKLMKYYMKLVLIKLIRKSLLL